MMVFLEEILTTRKVKLLCQDLTPMFLRVLLAKLLEQALRQGKAANVGVATQRDLPLPQAGRDDHEEDAGDDQDRGHR